MPRFRAFHSVTSFLQLKTSATTHTHAKSKGKGDTSVCGRVAFSLSFPPLLLHSMQFDGFCGNRPLFALPRFLPASLPPPTSFLPPCLPRAYA